MQQPRGEQEQRLEEPRRGRSGPEISSATSLVEERPFSLKKMALKPSGGAGVVSDRGCSGRRQEEADIKTHLFFFGSSPASTGALMDG